MADLIASPKRKPTVGTIIVAVIVAVAVYLGCLHVLRSASREYRDVDTLVQAETKDGWTVAQSPTIDGPYVRQVPTARASPGQGVGMQLSYRNIKTTYQFKGRPGTAMRVIPVENASGERGVILLTRPDDSGNVDGSFTVFD